MKKVIHVIGALVAGGAETFVVNLSTMLKKHVDVKLLVLSNRRDAKTRHLIDTLCEYNVEYEVGPTEKVSVASVIWYAKALRRFDPSVVHLHTPNTELMHVLSLSFLHRHRTYRTVHSLKPSYGRLTEKAIKFLRAQASVAVGTEVLKTVEQGPYNEPYITIFNGVRFEWPVSDREIKHAARDRLGLSPDAIIFLVVGRMSAKHIKDLPKAQDVIVRAWNAFSAMNKNVELHMLGEGNYRQELENLAGDTVFFHGVQNHVHQWMAACDWFVMPSRFEGLPIAGIEALGTGCNCIFSTIAPLKQLADDEVLWVEPNNTESLVNGLNLALLNDKPILNLPWIERFRESYSLEKTAKQYHELYV